MVKISDRLAIEQVSEPTRLRTILFMDGHYIAIGFTFCEFIFLDTLLIACYILNTLFYTTGKREKKG